jgi:IS5 family transposase
MAGLAILKHTYDLSDEALCDRWVENPYFQYFCGEEFSRKRCFQAAAFSAAGT